MKGFMTANEAAMKWDISHRRVIALCNENRIAGAAKLGKMWIVPADAEKPADARRTKSGAGEEGTKKFVVTIEETVSDEFELYAKTDEEARRIATRRYDSGEYVLAPGNLVSRQMSVRDIDGDGYTDWMVF